MKEEGGFDLIKHCGWHEWDPRVLREVGTHAKQILVRVCGLQCHIDYDRDLAVPRADVRNWRRTMHRLFAPAANRAAPIWIYFQHIPQMNNPRLRGRPFIYSRVWRDWAYCEPLHMRVNMLLRQLRAVARGPIYIHAEDFSARWVLRGGFTPAGWLLDNPMIGVTEAADLYSRPLSAPGVLRHSAMYHMMRCHWHQMAMHIQPEELLAAHLPIISRHGHWTIPDGVHQVPTLTPEPITRTIALRLRELEGDQARK